MCSTPLSEKLENATRRASSKKTKHRVGKKFGTIFSKQSSGEGGRFKKILFRYFQDFYIYSNQSFVSFNSFDSDFLPRSFTKAWVKNYIWNVLLYQNNETFWASKMKWKASKTERLLWSPMSLSNVFLTFFFFFLIKNCLVGNCHLYNIHAMFNSRLNFSFKGASNTNIVFIY